MQRIPVPELSIGSIGERVHRAKKRDRVRSLIVAGAIFLGALGAGTGVGVKLYEGVRIWLSGGKAAALVQSVTIVQRPTAADVRSALAHATFPVILPVGLPSGTRVVQIAFAPADRPNFVDVAYRNDRANFSTRISMFDASLVNTVAPSFPIGSERLRAFDVYRWRVGRELAIVTKASISTRDASRIRDAMTRSSPAESLAATDTILRKIIVLGASRPAGSCSRSCAALADIAERYAPVDGRSVLVGPQEVAWIPNLAKGHKPLRDPRIVFISNIPTVHGTPDYSNAMVNWPHTAISAAGVRAIDVVLRSLSPRSACSCEILFNQQGSATYWIWTIPLSPPLAVTKYSVDAKTFNVTTSR